MSDSNTSIPSLSEALTPAQTSVGVLGCGSVGSYVATILASAGVKRFVLADRDFLEPQNCRRHVGGLPDVGRSKVGITSGRLLQIDPTLSINTLVGCLLKKPDRLRLILEQVTVAIVAVDDEGLKYLVNDIAWTLGRRVVYAGVYGGGWGGEVIDVDPGLQTACYGCAAAALGRFGYAIEPTRTADYASYTPTEKPSHAWSQAHLGHIAPLAALTASVALRQLDLEPGHSAWRIAFESANPLQLAAWQLQGQRVAPCRDCPTCNAAQRVAERLTTIPPSHFPVVQKVASASVSILESLPRSP